MSDWDLLSEYMSVYIQLLPYCIHCGGMRLYKPQLPTFEYFISTYSDDRYSLSMPHYKDSRRIYDGNCISKNYAQGMGAEDGIAYRYYNYWMGCKYYTGGNVNGEFVVNTQELSDYLKSIN